MSIEQYIKSDILEKRLSDTSVVVVYDVAKRYQTLCGELVSEHCQVIDISKGSLSTRQQAISALSGLTAGKHYYAR